ncbi:hypothetical protein BN2127_JRS1_00506 [Bacillus cereus]|nr:hypothetical protein BN2127_JRS1_00506 [Bacillus cereus]
MKKTIMSVLAASMVLGGGTLASAQEISNQSQPSVDKAYKIQTMAARTELQTFHGPVEHYLSGKSQPYEAIGKFKLESNKKVTINGWQESTANGGTPNLSYHLVDTETNKTVKTIKLSSEYKQHGTWYNVQFDMTGVTIPKNYKILVENNSSNGARIGFDLYVDVYK